MPVRPNRLRHFLNYHNPETMEYDFDDVGDGPGTDQTITIVTNKLIRDLKGDVVWLIGRRLNRSTYYLYGKFKITGQGLSTHDGFKYEVWGDGSILPSPMPVTRSDWFEALLAVNPNLSQGFQSITDRTITDSMEAAFREAHLKAFGRFTLQAT